MESVQLASSWRKASYSTPDSSCVELAVLSGGGVAVRDSKLGECSPVLRFRPAGMAALLAAIKAGALADLA